jgi:ATP-dependent RNA helicase DDX41
LLIKGVGATGIHGGKAQEERNEAITQFRAGSMDVLVANDVAAKGLDFPAIQHVINYDMPNELESYVHRIGRTGRRGRTGVATTFVNRETPQEVLLDLKHLLMQARQVIPPFLGALPDPDEDTFKARDDGSAPKLCEYCGGFHRLQSCRKLQRDARAMTAAKRDFLGGQG